MSGKKGTSAATKGKFLKKSKLTLTEEVMQRERSRPSPAQYQFKNLDPLTGREKIKIAGTYSPKEKRVNLYDEAEWQGQQTPPAKYDHEKFNYTKPRTIAPKLDKRIFAAQAASPIPKTNDPGPGSYESPRAVKQTQWKRVEGGLLTLQAKNISFVELHSDLYKDNPGPNHYAGQGKLPRSLAKSTSR